MADKLSPPDYGYPDVGGERPPYVLIDPNAYFANRKNATTAVCDMEGPKLKGQLQVTFCAVAPPLVSYFCIHATHMDHTEFAVEPFIVATKTDGGLVLLCVVAGKHPTDVQLLINCQYFVYDACERQLYHLPHPGPQLEINMLSLAIMREPNKRPKGTNTSNETEAGHFVIAAQAHIFWGKKSPQLCIYHSATKTWSKKPVVADSSPKEHFTTKTFTIGGPKGTVAWVDLWCNIIFCDVLVRHRHPKLSCLNLPLPIRPGPDVGVGDPMSLRTIAVLGNTIKYVEMLPHPDRSSAKPPSHHWEVATWSIKKARHSWPKDWHTECKLDSTHIKVDSGTVAATLPTLLTLHVGLPTLSLQNNAVAYFLAKIDYRETENTAWVLAVDMETKTVTQAVEFRAERTLGLARGYNASSISAYLKA